MTVPYWYLIIVFEFQGADSMSDLAVSFHYMSAEQMYDMEYYVYQLRPYGVRFESEDLNARQISYSEANPREQKLAGNWPSARKIAVHKMQWT